MKITVVKNYDEMSVYAAERVAEVVRAKPHCVIGLATGRTPMGMYRELARLCREGLDLSGVATFNLDEYYGVAIDMERPYEMDQSYARFMYEEFFRHVNMPEDNINIPRGDIYGKEADNYVRSYEEKIKDKGGIDLQLLGIGGDGHWAFNEPGSSLSSRTRIVDLAEQTIEDNYENFYRKSGVLKRDMPRKAVTMGIGTILEARSLLMMASGRKKADVVAKAIEGPINTGITASAIQIHDGQAEVLLDEEAASRLAIPVARQ